MDQHTKSSRQSITSGRFTTGWLASGSLASLLVGLAAGCWLGCATNSKNDRPDDPSETATPVAQDTAAPETATAVVQEPDEAAATVATVTLTGTVIKKPWSKSTESWNAGGSEYYVLDVGDLEVAHRSAAEGVTLRATDQVSNEVFETMVGKRVTVQGVYVEAKAYTPQSPMEQYPQGMDGKPQPRGAGFQVSAISAAE